MTRRVANNFASFYEEAAPGIFSLARVMAGDDGEDLAAEAFARALVRWPEVSGYDRPDAWIRRVLVNLVVSRQRRKRVREAFTRRAAPGSLDRSLSDAVDDRVVLAAAIRQLSPMQRAVVALRFLHDSPIGDVAAALGISRSAASVHLARALENLRRNLGDAVVDQGDDRLKNQAFPGGPRSSKRQRPLGTRSR
jgi:RNA polymerase sigma factor (sigma-70 family)